MEHASRSGRGRQIVIVALTPNPSLDRTFDVTHLAAGSVLRASNRRVEPGGKGINVARALHSFAYDARAVFPRGGSEGEQLVQLLKAEGIRSVTVPIAGCVRSNVSVVEPNGRVTKLNEPGPRLTEEEYERLLAATTGLGRATWIVGSGSLPPSASTEMFAELIRRGHSRSSRVAIDSSGAPLRSAIDAGPDLIKPNHQELSEAVGRPILTIGDAVAAARRLHERGAKSVLASLGEVGAVLVDADGELHAELPVSEPRSTVGAGDAMLAGYLMAADAGRYDAIRFAVAFGAAAVALPGSQMPGPKDIQPELVNVTQELDSDQLLLQPSVRAKHPS